MQNLIDNSLKYTEQGWVKISLKESGDKAQFIVSDSGIGISPEILPTLFEQFQRGSKEARKIKGTGLGLYIAKQFVVAHEGDINVESEGEGKGSKFTVTLPKTF